MPKVTEEYFKNKKKQILEAAFSVCSKKPVYNVTMKDVIKESGLSQGGVYKYFANIDEILISLISRNEYDFKGTIHNIIDSGENPETVIKEIIDLFKKEFFSTIRSYGKILFEMQAIFFNEPERLDNYRNKIDATLKLNYWFNELFNYIDSVVEEGYFHPVISLGDICMFAIASTDGIVRNLILKEYYKIDRKLYTYKGGKVKDMDFNLDILMNALYETMLFLLGSKKVNNKV